ncbi:MAG: hypothetical protein AABY83_09005 [Pseudomonadota bacterium]
MNTRVIRHGLALAFVLGSGLTAIPGIYAAENIPAPTPPAVAEARPPAPEQAIGLSLGWVVANGLSYRQYFGHNYWQGTFAGLVDKEAGNSYLDLSVGFGRYLNRFDLERFAPIGLKMGAGIETEYRKGTQFGVGDGLDRKELHLGAGFGADIGNPTAHGLILSLDVFYTATFNNMKEFTKLRLLPSVSIHYNL